ncbi:hypothetical protein ACJRO7_007121 [Eucalyptus globulus]|uniref:F-box domain-containing protein n=1 Tax=Eucalyptus globulus TaxID=34317 RepID=A0ABD3IK40_EUCGL
MDELPLAILSNILRVSGESLLRYRCLCNRWQEVIDIPTSATQRTGQKNRCCYVRRSSDEDDPDSEIHETERLHLPRCCKGLLFFGRIEDDENNREFLINPLTKEIPHCQEHPIFHHTSRLMEEPHAEGRRLECTISRSDCGGTAEPTTSSSHGFVFAYGALNWFLSYSWSDGPYPRAMLSFDLTHEQFRLISLPEVLFKNGLHMPEMGGSLALVHYPKKMRIEVRVLKDDTRREWTRKYTIQPA